jgi:hypothetical protein
VIYPLLEEILLSKETHLSVLLHKQFVSLYRYLDLKINFSLASEHHWRPATGSMQRIISMCQDLKATNYINPWNGQTLYSFQDFQKHQLNLSFIRMKEHPYPQGNGDFIPSLSIIDILMWNSIEQIKESLGKYELFSSQEELRKENQPS